MIEKFHSKETDLAKDKADSRNPVISVITCEKNWLESAALSQLYGVAKLPGVLHVVGLPDLHAGKSPVGMALETQSVFYPHLIGGDIGCGMSLYDTGLAVGKYNKKRWGSRLSRIHALSDIETVNPYAEPSPIADLGTLGGGNHFAEFLQVEEVFNPDDFAKLNLPKNHLALLVHSGSRGFGQEILRRALAMTSAGSSAGAIGLAEDSPEAEDYLRQHDLALLWARRNRTLVAGKLTEWLGYDAEPQPLIELSHNFLERRENLWVHRKGAVSSEHGPVVLPGSRGSLTYLVQPAGDTAKSAYSLSHGAGRKWARSLCKSRIKNKYDRDSIRRTRLKSAVICHDTNLLFQEAPEAYKNIEHILTALLQHGLITLTASLRPVMTFKG